MKEAAAKLLFPKSTLRFFGKIDYATNDYLNDHYRAEEEKQLFFNGVARDFYRID